MDHSVFAIEVCLRADAAPGLVATLRERIKAHPRAVSRDAKWRFYRDCADDLLANLSIIERGCWDFFDDDARARRTFEDYSEPLRNERGARKEPSGSPERHGDPRYMTLTVAMLLVNGSPCERELSAMCDTPEEKLWRRETFLKMLRALLKIDYGVVKGDVLYLIPGDLAWGLTAADLADSKFAYLRQVV